MTELIIPTAYLAMFMITIYFTFRLLGDDPQYIFTALLIAGLMWPFFLPIVLARLRGKND